MSDEFIFQPDRPEGLHADTWRNPYRLAARELRRVVGELGQLAKLPDGSRLLDYGCAGMPYRDLCPDGVEYIGADLPGNELATVELKPDGSVPLPDASVDVVLSTQVLEHVADPHLYLRECHRLLKPGGALVLTTHGIMHFHEDPVDLWRWTSEGLRTSLVKADFDVVELRGIMGLAATSVQLFQVATTHKVPRRARTVYVGALQWVATQIDRRSSDEARLRDSLVLAVRARRPA